MPYLDNLSLKRWIYWHSFLGSGVVRVLAPSRQHKTTARKTIIDDHYLILEGSAHVCISVGPNFTRCTPEDVSVQNKSTYMTEKQILLYNMHSSTENALMNESC